MSKKLTIIFIILLLASVFCPAQTAQKFSEPSGLVLEVNYFKGKAPAHLEVFENIAGQRVCWFPLFKRVPNFQSSADSLPVKAVNIVSQLENSVVKVKVSVSKGQRFHEKEELVANYSMKENEKISVDDLTKFGIEPFEIALVKIIPTVSVLPAAFNKTSSLQITSIEPNYSTLPSYNVNLLNASGKAVLAFTYETNVNGRKGASAMPHCTFEKTLIEAGTAYKFSISNYIKNAKFSNGEIPQIENNQTIIITSVVFEDGTFEGDELDAARYLALSYGSQLQMQKMMPLVQKTADNKSDLALFGKEIADLSVRVDENAFREFTKNFPNLSESEKSRLRTASEVASQSEKKRLLDNLEVVIKSQQGKYKIEAREWLIAVVELYQNRLEKLSKITKSL